MSLYDRARKAITIQGELDRESDYLQQVFCNNGYPLHFICSALKESLGRGRGEDKEMEKIPPFSHHTLCENIPL